MLLVTEEQVTDEKTSDDILSEEQSNRFSYKDYTELWNYLLNSESFRVTLVLDM